MDTLESIFTRRSIRRYREDGISKEVLDTLLKAAMNAPSARNTQPWHFIVIDDREILNSIMQAHPYAQMLESAPLAVAIAGDTQLEENREYIAINCSAATENLLLAAHAMGLGGVWLGIYPREHRMNALSELLNLPENIMPISLIALGYPMEELPPVDRYSQERIHTNSW